MDEIQDGRAPGAVRAAPEKRAYRLTRV